MSFVMQILDKRKIYYFEKRLPYAHDFCFRESFAKNIEAIMMTYTGFIQCKVLA